MGWMWKNPQPDGGDLADQTMVIWMSVHKTSLDTHTGDHEMEKDFTLAITGDAIINRRLSVHTEERFLSL
jgi:hypothetical protein